METIPTPARTFAGLLISLSLPILFSLWFFPACIQLNYDEPAQRLLGLAGMWVILFLLAIYVKKVEHRGFYSIGWQAIKVRRLFFAVGLGILLSLWAPLVYALRSWWSAPADEQMDLLRHSPGVLLLGVITAAVTEEVLLRAYPLKRLRELTGNQVSGFVLSLGTFVLIHAGSWDLFHVLGVVLPLGLILTLLYLRTRNLPFLIAVHLVIDLPMFLGALMTGKG